MRPVTQRGGVRGYPVCLKIAALIVTGALLAGCGQDFNDFPDLDRPDTAVEYDVILDGAPNDEIRDLIEQSLLVYRRQEVGAQSFALLRRRARDDIATAQKILRSFGYYESTVEIDVEQVDALEPKPFSPVGTITGAAGAVADAATGTVDKVRDVFRKQPKEPAQPEVDREGPPPGGFANVNVVIDPGAQFVLAQHDFLLLDGGPEKPPPVIPSPEQFGSPVGGPAVAEDIILPENRAVQMLKQIGRPYAVRRDRDSVANLDLDTIEVITTIATGREYFFGDTRIRGAPNVSEEYLLTYKPYEAGERVDVRLLEEYQSDLIDTGLFDSGSVRLPEDPPRGDGAPVLVELEERPPRTVSAGAEYATDTGPGFNLGFEHRNLGRANETISADLLVGTERQLLETLFRKPQYRRPGQDLIAGISLERRDDEVYEGISLATTAGIEREVDDFWTVGGGVLLDASLIDEDGDEEAGYLAGLPVYAIFDDTDDLLDPTRGVRLDARLTPFAGISDNEAVSFLKAEIESSTYWDITKDESYILAVRGRLGSIIGADTVDDVPAPRRFYSGGGGSVRGYENRTIGPLDSDEDPTGGLSVVEAAAELRTMPWLDQTLGGVVFVDTGTVTEEAWPSFSEGYQVAVGTGLRYKSPVGPIRFDIAFPVNPRDVDDTFQFYVSIGQAF